MSPALPRCVDPSPLANLDLESIDSLLTIFVPCTKLIHLSPRYHLAMSSRGDDTDRANGPGDQQPDRAVRRRIGDDVPPVDNPDPEAPQPAPPILVLAGMLDQDAHIAGRAPIDLVVGANYDRALFTPARLEYSLNRNGRPTHVAHTVAYDRFHLGNFNIDEERFRREVPHVQDLNVERTYSTTNHRHRRGDVVQTTWVKQLRYQARAMTNVMSNSGNRNRGIGLTCVLTV